MMRFTRCLTAAFVVSAAALTACSVSVGTRTVDKNEVASQISSKLEEQVGRKPDSVECPQNLDARKDATLVCTLTDQGSSYDVTVTVTSVEGDKANFDINVANTPKN
ncbi:DUF4333 domain-containing protein [Nocardia sp. alder85J]|uniref:DUF4333 domain-containing protein n=1 Tax=Nocardia sp. alder85J TaxID=2862949 RepID=UPI001CD2722C|nr:DUF4333 domain-containing protein [Nocardia sp. alder85J]MCX4094062.1 DUF4333 domain-containing protein [Nocardia sp. alder85J]